MLSWAGINCILILFYNQCFQEIFAEDRTEILGLEPSIPSDQRRCFTLKYKLKNNYFLSKFSFITKDQRTLLYKFESPKANDPGIGQFLNNYNFYYLEQNSKNSQDTVCFVKFPNENINQSFVFSIESKHSSNPLEEQNPEKEFNLLKVAKETFLYGVIFEPRIPVLNDKLCMKPHFSVEKGHFIKKMLLETKNDNKDENIYFFERTNINVTSDIRLNEASSFRTRIEDLDLQENHKICFKNITDKETGTEFWWKILTRDQDPKGDITETFKDYKFSINAVAVKEAQNEITNFKTESYYIKPSVREFCNSISYTIITGYSKNQILLQVEEKGVIVTLYRFIWNKDGNTGNISFINQTEPWNGVLDKTTSTSTHSIVCFKNILSSILNLKYLWRLRIENVNNATDLKTKTLSFVLNKDDIKQPTVPPTVPTATRGGLSIGAIVGIIIAVVVIIVIVIIIIIWKKQKQRGKAKDKRKDIKYDGVNVNSTEEEKKAPAAEELKRFDNDVES